MMKIKKTYRILLQYSGMHYIIQRFNKMKIKNRNALIGLFFISPWLLGLIGFGLYPLYSSLRMSFSENARYIFDQTTRETVFKIEGFSLIQFKSVFKDYPNIVQEIITFIYNIALIIPLTLVFALILALLLNQKVKLRAVFRAIYFIPVILLSGSMLSYFRTYGLLTVQVIHNQRIIDSINFYFPEFISNIIMGAFQMIVLILWLSGVQILVFLAGLQKIDQAIYEAASIDGASSWEMFWKITLPSLIPLMLINIIYTTVIYTNLSNNPLISIINESMIDPKRGRDFAASLSWIVFLIDLGMICLYALIIKLASKKYV